MNSYEFKIDGEEFKTEVKDIDGVFYEVTVNGAVFTVEMKEGKPKAQPKKIKKPVIAAKEDNAPAASAGGSEVKAPLPGTITSIKIKEGDKVAVGDVILVFEAMKMENNVLAEAEGTVKEISVKEGENVLEGAKLAVIA